MSDNTSAPPVSLARHSINYVAASATAVIGGLVMLPVYTRALSPGDYGLLETILRFVNVCMVVGFLGMRQAFARFYFDSLKLEWPRVLTSSAVFANFAIAGAVLFPLLLVGSFFAPALGIQRLTVPAVFVLTAWLMFEASFLLGMSFLQVRLNSKAFVLAQTARVLLLVAANMTALHVLKLGLNGALIGTALTSCISGAVASLYLLSWSGLRISRPTVKDMLGFGLPYIPSALFAYVATNADRIALLLFGTGAVLGLLSLASKMVEIGMSIFAAPIDNLWAPYAFRNHSEPDGAARIGRMYTQFTAVSVLLVLGICLAAPIPIKLLTTRDYQPAAELVPIVGIGWIFGLLATLSDIGILIKKRTRLKPFIMAASALSAVAFQATLVPVAGLVGAALATTCTSMVLFIIVKTVSSRLYRLETRDRDFLSIILAAAAGYFIGKLVAAAIPSMLGDVIATLLGATIYVATIYLCRVISLNDAVRFAGSIRHRKRAA